MTHFSVLPRAVQPDEALLLLADFYARRVAVGPLSANNPLDTTAWHAYERIRDLLYQAPTQTVALEHLTHLVNQVDVVHASDREEEAVWRGSVERAADLVREVLAANGSAQVLLAGETDGFRHLCRRCCQDEANFQRVRYFEHATRRPLLKAEVSNAARSLYGKCQVCEQVLVPNKLVVLVPGGTSRHYHKESCPDCNKNHVAFLAALYECAEPSLAIRLPSVASLAAPSAQQARQRALRLCWDNGWYLLSSSSSEGKCQYAAEANI
jgi:hypothetical protein